jgi:glycosyltransferase involved in cell wall biosynthesis
LPYRRILTSGGALLALSLRRPVIAPGFASLREVLEDGRDSLLYPPEGGPAALAAALRRFASLDATTLERLQAGAYATARRYDWRQSGLLLGGLFHHLTALRKPQRVPARPA